MYLAEASFTDISFTYSSDFISLYFNAPCFQAEKKGFPTSVASTGIQTFSFKTTTSDSSKKYLERSSGFTPLSNIKKICPAPGLKTSRNIVSMPKLAIRDPYKAVRSSQSPILSLSISPGYLTVSNADLSSAISRKGVSRSILYTSPCVPNASNNMIALPRLLLPK